jgi:hypothetical protein
VACVGPSQSLIPSSIIYSFKGIYMERKVLSAAGMFKKLHEDFKRIPEHRTNIKNIKISMADASSSILAMFSLKTPSLLAFEKKSLEPTTGANLRNLFNIENVPSDTQARDILDEVKTESFRPIFKGLFAEAQRGGTLKNFDFIDGTYLLALDGTQVFSSDKVHCDFCLEKHFKDDSVNYSHQMLAPAIVYPGCKSVILLYPEMINKQDGNKKNDCERNAAKRILEKLHEDYPRLKFTIIEDGISSNIPHIRAIIACDYNYILGAKPGDHKYLFDWVAHDDRVQEYEITFLNGDKVKKKIIHQFKYVNGVPLNDSNENFLVNFIDYVEITMASNDGGETFTERNRQKFSWVTNIKITKDNILTIMRGGRARWKIENEVFNTLKNQGYQLEHNFGHGFKNLCNNFVMLMMLAFMVDQLQELCCSQFAKALAKRGTKKSLWETMSGLFQLCYIDSWLTLFDAIINPKNYSNCLRLNSC